MAETGVFGREKQMLEAERSLLESFAQKLIGDAGFLPCPQAGRGEHAYRQSPLLVGIGAFSNGRQ
jgi:hypothetical protein